MNAAIEPVTSGAPAEHYRAEIDGLRGIAVLAVVGYHAFPDHFPGGFIGVDVFFVISGFLITSIITRQLRTSTFTFRQFYARRIRRIFPALLLVLLASLLFGTLALLPDELAELGKHAASAAAFSSNFTLWQESGYFDRAAETKPLLHLWSLGIEEQFYVLWPLLFLLLWQRQQQAALGVLILTLASFAVGIGIGRDNPDASFYFPFARFWELGLGCLLAIVRESPPPLVRRLDSLQLGPRGAAIVATAHAALPCIGIGLIATGIFLFDHKTDFPGWAALAPTLGALCVLSAPDCWLQRRILASTSLVLLGTISYPLYLWHWPFLSFAIILESGTPRVLVRVIAVAASVALAWLTYKYFERPIRARRDAQAITALVAGLAILGITGLVMHAARGLPDRFAFTMRTIEPSPRTNTLCLRNFAEEIDFNYCKSTRAEPPLAVFLGDSRTQAIYDGVVDLLGAHHSLTLLARGGCPPMLNVDLHQESKACDAAWRTFIKYVADAKPAMVVLVGGGANLLKPVVAERGGDRLESRKHALERGLRALITTLQRTSRVIFVLEMPHFPSSPTCVARRIQLPGSQCSPTTRRSDVEAKLAPYNDLVRSIQADTPQLVVIDSISALCDAARCSQTLASGDVLYSDRLHLSTAGGRHFARESALVPILSLGLSGRSEN